MKIGLDFDGVVAKQLNIPIRLPQFVFAMLALFAPAAPNLEILKRIAEKHLIAIVTSRPKGFKLVTQLWLWWHKLNVQTIRCVGLKICKNPVLIQEQVDIFFDDKSRYIEAAKNQGINAHLFQSWEQTEKILTQNKGAEN